MNKEVVVDGVVVDETYAKNVLLKLINDRDNVEVDDVLNLERWMIRTGNYTEDCAVVVESWLQEHDILISDEFDYYRTLMEETPTSR